MSNLLNPCKYSFNDLIKASNFQISTEDLYNMSQKERNKYVKNMCNKAKWFFEDVIGNDNITYTSFSPYLKTKQNVLSKNFECENM